ncbi:hypothetical protein PV328_000390 [Microctonus aethiopoides]|uniref:Prenylcysteine lyase domain-containing protein n=1 Tax=Microctonus aethiopoides TaxID=144406 RepID=A0AA39FVE0_9HYME|nr:hypothetical protein PV328_000390 [Microctonus aethiopoides]
MYICMYFAKMKAYKYIFFSLTLILPNAICTEDCIPKIAIIGGGIGGASASHFLNELFDNNKLLKIDLFEGNEIGGRLATININENNYESGGAIIHNRNKLMKYFAKYLGLEERNMFANERFGIWSGNEFLFEDSSYEVVTLAKLVYRYGLQPFYLDRFVNALITDFHKIYELQDNGIGFNNVTSLLSAMNEEFPQWLEESIKNRLLRMGYDEQFIDEMVKTTIVVNYGQSTNIQSFAGFVSVAGAGTSLWSVKGGNKEVPKQLISRNKNIRVVPAVVKKIIYSSEDDGTFKYTLNYIDEENSQVMINDVYDVVIIAIPLTQDQSMSIEFVNFPDDVNLKFPGNYQTTYATFVKGQLNMSYFGLDYPIDNILSCNPDKSILSSVGNLCTVEGIKSDVWKIFSRNSLKKNIIDKFFEKTDEVKEIEWKAYPKYSTEIYANKFKLHHHLYHVNAIEWAASAMEMSAIGGRNVAILAYNDYEQKCKDIHGENDKAYFNRKKFIPTFHSEF